MPDQKRAAGAAAAPQRAASALEPHCRCGLPMHPDHVEEHRGERAERYTCPRRRWWNFWRHHHAWMKPRDANTHRHA